MGYAAPLGVSKPGMMSTGTTNYATVNNYIGSEAVATELSGLHKPEVDAEIERRYGRDDLSGLLSALPGYRKEVKYRKEFRHFEKDFIHGVVTATWTVAGGAGQSSTFTLTSGSDAQISGTVSPYISTATNDVVVPQKNDVLMLPGRIEVMVTEVTISSTPGASTFVAYPLDATVTIAEQASAAECVIKANLNEEGSGEVGKTRNSKLLLYQNQMGIFRRKHDVTGSELGEQIWVEAEGKDGQKGMFWYYEGVSDEYQRFKNEIEMVHFDGKSITNTNLANLAGFETVTKPEGMVQSVIDYGNSLDYGATLTLAHQKTVARNLDKFKGDKLNLKLVGYEYRDQYNSLFREGDGLGDASTDPGRITFTQGMGIEDLAINLDFERVKLNGYTFMVKQTNALSDPTTLGAAGMGYTNMGITIPTGNTTVYNDLNDAGSKTSVRSITYNYKTEPNGDSREYKEWVTGGAGGVATNGVDRMTVWMLAECGIELYSLNKYFVEYTTA